MSPVTASYFIDATGDADLIASMGLFRYLDGREGFDTSDFEHEWRRRWPETQDNPTFYQIPYLALVPWRAYDVLVCGCLLDSDEGALGALRVMLNCNQMGEAAGTAACLAVNSH